MNSTCEKQIIQYYKKDIDVNDDSSIRFGIHISWTCWRRIPTNVLKLEVKWNKGGKKTCIGHDRAVFYVFMNLINS